MSVKRKLPIPTKDEAMEMRNFIMEKYNFTVWNALYAMGVSCGHKPETIRHYLSKRHRTGLDAAAWRCLCIDFYGKDPRDELFIEING